MTHPDILTALVRDRQNMLLAKAEARHRGTQARAHRHSLCTPPLRRPLFRRAAVWLTPAWSRLLTRRPGSVPLGAYQDRATATAADRVLELAASHHERVRSGETGRRRVTSRR